MKNEVRNIQPGLVVKTLMNTLEVVVDLSSSIKDIVKQSESFTDETDPALKASVKKCKHEMEKHLRTLALVVDLSKKYLDLCEGLKPEQGRSLIEISDTNGFVAMSPEEHEKCKNLSGYYEHSLPVTFVDSLGIEEPTFKNGEVGTLVLTQVSWLKEAVKDSKESENCNEEETEEDVCEKCGNKDDCSAYQEKLSKKE